MKTWQALLLTAIIGGVCGALDGLVPLLLGYIFGLWVALAAFIAITVLLLVGLPYIPERLKIDE